MDDADGSTTLFLENHDNARSVSRFGCGSQEYYAASAKMMFVLLITLSGTLFMYQGQELGLVNIPGDWPVEEYKDAMTQNKYEEVYRS
jgi:oligo-1,6-glucosidase